MRRSLPPLLIAATALVAPASASAHGLVQRSNLPIPEWLFGWGAAIVLVISFVALAALWPKPRMEGRPPWRPLPGGAVLGSRPVEVLCGAIGVALSKSAWTGPTANEVVDVTFGQLIKRTDPLRTGSYTRTLTFTLSTTSP